MPDVPLIPARMLNEYAYCPRLAYLEWVQREWDDNAETMEGKLAHRRVDRPEGARAKLHRRSVHLSSEKLGLTAVIDLIESDRGRVRPVDYKRGKKPAVKGGAWEPERVQVCAQGLLLREHGFECREGLLYFQASKQKVRVRLTPGLIERTLALAGEMRELAGKGRIPEPLEDSPKCPRCSLVRICLPEETNFLRRGLGEPRRLAVGDPPRFPLVVQEPRARVRLRGERLIVEVGKEPVATARLGEISHVALFSGAHPTSAALAACCREGITVLHLSGTGWLNGVTTGYPHRNVELRMEQFAAARDERALEVGRALVAAKVHNSRTLARRHGDPPKRVLARLAQLADAALDAPTREELLGIEGEASRLYYREAMESMLSPDAVAAGFGFEKRTRRPPRDAFNAVMSFASALLTKDWSVTCLAVGFDPMVGLYHVPKWGSPALALDLMEPFRPAVVDSVVLTAINNGEIRADDVYDRPGGILLKPAARKSLVSTYERRLAIRVRHPVFGYRVTYRRLFELEARLLGRYLLGEIPRPTAFRIR